MKRLVGVGMLALAVGLGGVAAAHHVGTFVPRDSEVSANFKQIKFAIMGGKFDAALKLFDEGALHAEMEKMEKRLPPGLEDRIRAALKAENAPGVEVGLMVFMAFLARDLVREAERRLDAPAVAPSGKLARTGKLLEAVWRYYNLVDFVVYQRDVKAALSMRLAFDDAEGAVGGGGSDPMKGGGSPPPTRGNPCGVAGTELKPAVLTPKDPSARLTTARQALGRMSEILTRVIEQSAQPALAIPAGAGATRP